MKNILIVSGSVSILSKVDKYLNDGLLDSARIVFAIEFFGKRIPNNLPSSCVPVMDFLDQMELDAVASELRKRGDFSSVIAFDETSLYTAAEFRRRLGCLGPSKAELEKFRDKVVMKESLSDSGIRVPRVYMSDELKRGLAAFPLVAKPRAYCGSIGVRILKSEAELETLLNQAPAPKSVSYDTRFSELDIGDLQFEEFIEGQIFHIDGLTIAGEIKFVIASKYIHSCLEFISGLPIGSVTVANLNEQAAWASFARTVIKHMRVPDGAFHLEAFVTPAGDRVFLEIASRLPGGLILNVIDLVFGIDLRWAHIVCQLNMTPELVNLKIGNKFGGFLIFPMNYIDEGRAPSKFVHNFTTLSKAELPTLEWSKYPEIGSPAENEFAYEHNLGGVYLLWS